MERNNLMDHILQNIQDIIQEQTADDEPKNKPVSKEFINTLETIQIKDEDYTCLICMEKFKEGEECIKLPCKDTPHYFHNGKHKDICEGILPWFSKNNTCPCCRTEFPEEDEVNLNSNRETNNDNTDIIENLERLIETRTGEIIHNIIPPPINTFQLIFRNPPRQNMIQNMITTVTDEYQREMDDIQRAIELSLNDQ